MALAIILLNVDGPEISSSCSDVIRSVICVVCVSRRKQMSSTYHLMVLRFNSVEIRRDLLACCPVPELASMRRHTEGPRACNVSLHNLSLCTGLGKGI